MVLLMWQILHLVQKLLFLAKEGKYFGEVNTFFFGGVGGVDGGGGGSFVCLDQIWTKPKFSYAGYIPVLTWNVSWIRTGANEITVKFELIPRFYLLFASTKIKLFIEILQSEN